MWPVAIAFYYRTVCTHMHIWQNMLCMYMYAHLAEHVVYVHV